MDKLDLIYNTVKEQQSDIKEIRDRLARLEERSTIRAMIAGAIAGVAPGLALWFLGPEK